MNFPSDIKFLRKLDLKYIASFAIEFEKKKKKSKFCDNRFLIVNGFIIRFSDLYIPLVYGILFGILF